MATRETLVVDLDSTLLRSDMLYESFWYALRRDWRIPVTVERALAKGRAALKQHLAGSARVEAGTLPYDAEASRPSFRGSATAWPRRASMFSRVSFRRG